MRLQLPAIAVVVNKKILAECGEYDDLKILKSLTHFRLGNIFAAVGSFSIHALESFRNAFMTHPCNLPAYHSYSTYAHSFQGDVSAHQLQMSIDFIKKVIHGTYVTPDSRVVYRYYNLSQAHECSFFADDAKNFFNGSKPMPFLRPMDAYYEVETILSKALSRLLHVAGDFTQSWRQLSGAMNYHRNISMSYFQLSQVDDIINSTYLKTMEVKSSIISSIHQQRILTAHAVSSQSKIPVFIVGFHNSGAAILSSLLSECCQHIYDLNDVRVRSKFSFHLRADSIIQDIVAGSSDVAASLRSLSKDLLQHIKTEFSSGDESDNADSISDEILRSSSTLYQGYVELDRKIKKNSTEFARYSVTKQKRRRLTSSTRVILTGDELYFYIDLIRSLYPQALIVNVLRDPMDVLFECVKDGIASQTDSYRQKSVFGWGLNAVVDYKALVGEYILYLNMIRTFKAQEEKGGASASTVVDIQFESLLSNPTGVLAYLGNIMNTNCDFKAARGFTKRSTTVASIGAWPRYFEYLNKTLISTARTFFSDLMKKKSLPFLSESGAAGHRSANHIIECKSFGGGLEKYCTYAMNWNLDPAFNYSSMVLEISSSKGEEAVRNCAQESEECELASDSDHPTAREADSTASSDTACSQTEKNGNIQDMGPIFIGKSLSRKIQSIIQTVDGYADSLEVEDKLANLSSTLERSLLYDDVSTCMSSGNEILTVQAPSFSAEADRSITAAERHAEVHCLENLLLLTLLKGRLLSSLGRGNAAVREIGIAINILRIFNDSTSFSSAKITDASTSCTNRDTNIRVTCESSSTILRDRQYSFHNCPRRSFSVDTDSDVWVAKLQADAFLQSDNASSALQLLIKLIAVPIVYPIGDYSIYYHTALAFRETDNFVEKHDSIINVISKLSDSVRAQYGLSTGGLLLDSTTCDCCLPSDDSSGVLTQRSNMYWSLFLFHERIASSKSVAWQFLRCAHIMDLHNINVSYSFGSYFIEQVEFNSFITTTFTRDFWKEMERNSEYVAGPAFDRRVIEFQRSLKSIRLLFIVSFFRSGSTLLETILDAHPSVWGMGEHSIFGLHMEAFEKEFNTLLGDENSHQERLQVVQKFRMLIVEDIVRSRRRANESDAVFVIDKMLNNYRNIGYIHLLFPVAKILYVLRDPMDALVSCYSTRFKNPLLRYLAADPDKLAREYVMHLQLMSFYLANIDQRYLFTVGYEKLVAHPVSAIQDILTRLGLPGSGSVLVNEFFLRQRVVHTASRFQVNKAVYNTSVGRWTRHASEPAVIAIKNNLLRYFEKYLGNYSLPLNAQDDHDREINWQMDNSFNYTDLLRRLSIYL